MKNKGSKYDISVNFLKLCNEHVSIYLSILFNLCVENGFFPDPFKIAVITPIHKKGNKNEISNYRPISVLCNLNKIFEELLNVRIKNYFTSNNLLSENQFGFREKKSTEQAVLNLIGRVMPAIDKKMYAICVFIDYSACFDTIRRDILINKLLKYGVRGNVLNLIKSYFTNRLQYVNYGSVKSEILEQGLGVIQGSKNGPLFFDIYSNDLSKMCTENECLLFADDTCLTYIGDNLDALVQNVNDRLSSILDWCRYNKLSINPSKSEYMIITNLPIPTEPSIYIGPDRISRSSCVKYLGMHIDSNLKFTDHVFHLTKKLSRLAGISYKLGKYLNLRAAKNYYYSCVYSVLTYCLSVWGGIVSCTQGANCLTSFQRRIVTQLFSKYYTDTSCIFKSTNLLKLVDIHKLYASIYMFKVIKLNSCEAIGNNLDLRRPHHQYLTRNRDRLLTPFPRVNAIKFNFQYQFTNVWNEVPDEIKNVRTLRLFKKKLTCHLLSLY